MSLDEFIRNYPKRNRSSRDVIIDITKTTGVIDLKKLIDFLNLIFCVLKILKALKDIDVI